MMFVRIWEHHTQAALVPEEVHEDAYSILACLYSKTLTKAWTVSTNAIEKQWSWRAVCFAQNLDVQKFIQARLEPQMKKVAAVHIYHDVKAKLDKHCSNCNFAQPQTSYVYMLQHRHLHLFLKLQLAASIAH